MAPIVVLNRKLIKMNNRPVAQVLIQWSHAAPEDATWEDATFIQAQFPQFDL